MDLQPADPTGQSARTPPAAGPLVLVFDMDGVLLDTEAVKLACFREAFAPLCDDDPATLAAVHAYNAAHRGVPRDVKIRHLLGTLGRAGERGGPDAAARVAEAYAALLLRRLPRCGTVPGVVEFLSAVPAVRYVASSAPVPEITANLRRHGLSGHFAHCYGAPVGKAEALAEVARRHPGARRFFLGDAPADLAAARATGTPFLAVNPHPDLAEAVPEHFADFRPLAALTARLRGGG